MQPYKCIWWSRRISSFPKGYPLTLLWLFSFVNSKGQAWSRLFRCSIGLRRLLFYKMFILPPHLGGKGLTNRTKSESPVHSVNEQFMVHFLFVSLSQTRRLEQLNVPKIVQVALGLGRARFAFFFCLSVIISCNLPNVGLSRLHMRRARDKDCVVPSELLWEARVVTWTARETGVCCLR